MKKTEWITILKKIKTTCQEKLKSEQFRKDTVVLPLLAGLALVMILAAVIAGIRSISSVSADGQMESRAASASDSSARETSAEPEESLQTDTEPEKRSGFYTENGVLYYYNEDGSLYLGWFLSDENWYYFTDQGAVTGYQTISEYGREDECYFEEDGRLVMDAKTPDGRMADSDGYLVDAQDAAAEAEDWSAFEVEAARNLPPGALSGLHISGEPAEFYMLSIAGESSGGQILMGDRGRAYGLCQFDYRHDLTDFMRWAYNRHPSLWQEFSAYTEKTVGDESLVDNRGICQAFANARTRDYEAAISDELEYMRMDYWDSFVARMNAAGYRLSERHIAVSAAFFSVLVNCGKKTAVFLENLSPDMTDAQMICGIYKIRNTILAEQTVGRSKKGTTARYRMAEPRMALDLLHGFTTIDSVKDYGGGVRWKGNLFTGTVLTSALNGSSTEWEEALAETMEETEMESGVTEEVDSENSDGEHNGEENTGEKNTDGKNAGQTETASVIVTGKAAKKMAETAESAMEPDAVSEQDSISGNEAVSEKNSVSGQETAHESESVAGHERKADGNTKTGSESADTQPDMEKQAE